MALSSVTIPPLSKTPVSRVECYFLGHSKDGAVELYDMHRIDYDEAVAAHPDDWALTPPARLGVKIVDMRAHHVFPTPEQTESPGPPTVDREVRVAHNPALGKR